MNVDNLPGAHYRWAAYGLLGLMLVVGFGMFYLFRKKNWL